jgi:hypothetical protein
VSPIATAADAERTIEEVGALIATLSGLLEEETALIRAGRIKAAAAMEPAKKELAGRLVAAAERVKANAAILHKADAAGCAALNRAQDAFRAVLQRNMVVLATAHAVSEGIMRRLSGDLARKASPQVYGASGRTASPNPQHGRPLALSRTL